MLFSAPLTVETLAVELIMTTPMRPRATNGASPNTLNESTNGNQNVQAAPSSPQAKSQRSLRKSFHHALRVFAPGTNRSGGFAPTFGSFHGRVRIVL
jgi:hypothetical protein